MRWWFCFRARTLVCVFGMLTACSKCPPAGEPVAPEARPQPSHSTPGHIELGSLPIAEPDKRVVLGSDGEPIGEGGPSRDTSGESPCPPPTGEACQTGKQKSCQVHERVSCRTDCDGYRSQHYVCENGSWSLHETREAACECVPKKLPAELAACTARYVSVSPSELSPSDGCTLGLTCAGREFWLECDGENDGTNTSLCQCWRDRQEQRIGDLFPGDGPDACFSAAAECFNAR